MRPDGKSKERFHELMALCFGDGKEAQAMLLLNAPESSVRNWMDFDGSCPSKAKMAQYLALMGLPADALRLDDEKWEIFTRQAPELVAKRFVSVSPGWLYSRGQMQVIEECATQGSYLILITADAYNDTHIPGVYDILKRNLGSGVSYLYVVPATCTHLPDLRELVARLRRDTETSATAGKIGVLIAAADGQTEWRFIDHVLLTLSRPLVHEGRPFATLISSDFSGQYEQLYRSDDVQEGHLIWVRVPSRKASLYIDLLKKWEVSGTWET